MTTESIDPQAAFALPAAVDMSTTPNIALVVNASGQFAVCGVGARPDAFLKNIPTSGKNARGNFGPGIHKVVLGGTVAVADQATINSTGQAIKAMSSGGVIVGRFLDAGTVGQFVRLLVPFGACGTI